MTEDQLASERELTEMWRRDDHIARAELTAEIDRLRAELNAAIEIQSLLRIENARLRAALLEKQ